MLRWNQPRFSAFQTHVQANVHILTLTQWILISPSLPPDDPLSGCPLKLGVLTGGGAGALVGTLCFGFLAGIWGSIFNPFRASVERLRLSTAAFL